MFIVTLILFRVDATSDVHSLDFNKGILILEMHGTNIKKKKTILSVLVWDFIVLKCSEVHELEQ